MRLRFLGAPHVSKPKSSPPVVVDLPAVCKEEPTENKDVVKTSQSAPANDVVLPRQLRQRRVGVGLWAVRRQKQERAQLRPRIVVHMSRLRGRRTTANFGSANLHAKRKSCRSLAAKIIPPIVTTDKTTFLDLKESRIGDASTVPDTGVDATNGIKLEKLQEDEIRHEADNGQVQDNGTEQKPAGDRVNSRPKRHIMQKNMVSYTDVHINILDSRLTTYHWKVWLLIATENWWGTGMVICLERDADLHMAQLMPLPLTLSCFSIIQIGFTFLVPAHPGSPGKKAVKRVCVCVCTRARALQKIGIAGCQPV